MRSFSSNTFVILALFSTKLFEQATSFASQTCLIRKSALTTLYMSSSTSFMDVYSAAVADATGNSNVKLEPTRGAGAGGGGGASVSAAVDSTTGTKYFIKSANVSSGGGKMLKAEYLGVKEMSEANAIRVPTPIAYGEHSGRAFVIFEYLEFCGGGDGREMGRQLALMHKKTSEQGFGFHVDNTIGKSESRTLLHR